MTYRGRWGKGRRGQTRRQRKARVSRRGAYPTAAVSVVGMAVTKVVHLVDETVACLVGY